MGKWSNPGRHAATLSETLSALAGENSKDPKEMARVVHDAEFQGSLCGRGYGGNERYSEAAVKDWDKVADAHRKAIGIIERIQGRMAKARQVRAEKEEAEAERGRPCRVMCWSLRWPTIRTAILWC